MRLHYTLFTIGLGAALCSAQAPPQFTISTIAGNGTSGYAGDAGPATSAELNIPSAAVPAGGNIYIADQANNRIRFVETSGNITSIAGITSSGYSGDTGAANKATLNSPSGLAVDSKGNVYIADTANQAIRFVTTDGKITTFAGGSVAGGDGDGGPASSAQLNLPSGMALDAAGNVYFADTGNNKIRKIATNGIITTVAGNGSASYSGDGGLATFAGLNRPQGVAFDTAGNMYIADTGNHVVRMVSNGNIATIAGNHTAGFKGDSGLATAAELNYPAGVGVDAAGNIYIADTSNQRVRVVTNGQIFTVAGTGGIAYAGDGGSATKAQLSFPKCVYPGPNGTVYVCDTQHSVVRLLTPATPAGVPTISAVENAADYQVKTSDHGAAPNSFISIYATPLSTGQNTALFPATAYQGLQVLFNGNAAPLYAVVPSANLINLVLPAELSTSGTAVVNVSNTSGFSRNFTLNLAADDVGIFKLSADSAHPNNGAVTIAGTAWDVMPASTAAAYGLASCTGLAKAQACGQPAHVGDIITIYFTGGGTATNAAGKVVATGTVAPLDGSAIYKTTVTPTVTIGGVPATVTFCGIAPGTAAEYQLNTTIPAGVQSGDSVEVKITFPNSSDTATIAVAAVLTAQ